MRTILSSIALFTAASAGATLVTYPAGPGVDTYADDFAVEVRQGDTAWQPLDVYPVKVDEVRGTRHCVETASMAYFDFDGRVDVRVIHRRGAVDSARVRPLSRHITPMVSGDTLTFSLDAPANLSVEVDGDIFHNLHLFANPLDSLRPSARDIKRAGRRGSRLIYFGPGLHELEGGVMQIPSGHTVYIDGGARVVGTLRADSVSDVRICGRGEVHPRGRGEGVYIACSRRVSADGIIVTQIPTGGSDSVRITNVKAISSYGWGDGMNVFASDNVSYDRVFCRTSDDCTTVYATRKGFRGGCRNISMTRSTLWADVAHPIMIGLHGAATEVGVDAPSDTICDLLYRDIDILDCQERQLDYQGCIAIDCSDNNVVRDITFDDIRVEDFRRGRLFDIRIFQNSKYCAAPGRSISGILFKDVTYDGSGDELSIIEGYDGDRRVADVTFENLTINGRRISDDMPGKPKWYKTGDMARIFIGNHVDNVIFR
ncbi:MAG: endo-polygalacturonase [Bacteroides sp.]|nr:endo-polygalacturonase [Bacteroides sp.]MCM1095290.1 hypothetical protein [Terasakiella sp.]